MSYLNSVTIIGFVGADPEQRQARNNNGWKFTALFLTLERAVATQRSWKNTDDEGASKTEWHRVCVFRPRLAEYVLTTIKKGSHVLVEDDALALRIRRLLPVMVERFFASRTPLSITEWFDRRNRTPERTAAPELKHAAPALGQRGSGLRETAGV